MMAEPLSLVVTTFNNATTIECCLLSAAFAQETLVLDSFSTDASLEKAAALGARIEQQAFAGYGPQKQCAISLAKHDWVLLLDADEELSPALAEEIETIMNSGPAASGYKLLRAEWLGWRWPATTTRLTDHLRLFDRRKMQMGDHPVHAAPAVTGKTITLKGRLLHHGEKDLHTRIDRINRYTTATVPVKLAEQSRFVRLKMLFYPCLAFLKEYLIRRHVLNGWAGFIAARAAAIHVFVKYAKVYEARKIASLSSRKPD
jgi:glycosyltransferase involved in cell wall biosynthesis